MDTNLNVLVHKHTSKDLLRMPVHVLEVVQLITNNKVIMKVVKISRMMLKFRNLTKELDSKRLS